MTPFAFLKRCLILFTFLTASQLLCIDLDHAIVSLYAVNTETGEVLHEKNCDLSLTPGSCMKIVTTAAALQLLGADYRFETHLEYDGFIDQTHTLQGNLYIRGGGDPCLGSDRIPKALSWKKQIETWADAVQRLDIQKIEGKVIGDASAWEKAMAVPSWEWEDLGSYYGAGACALSFHENFYTLSIKPGNTIGEEASIVSTDLPLPPLALQNEVKTGAKGAVRRIEIFGSEFSPIHCIRGTVPQGEDEFAIKGVIPDPPAFCADLLCKELELRGISVKQKQISEQTKRTVCETTYSPTVQEIVHWANQKSINLYAEHLLKKIGEVVYHDGSTASGVKTVTEFWKSQNVDLSGFHMADGSGLSRKNLITSKLLVEILLKIKQSAIYPLFFDSLPQKEGLMKAKSGTMSLVKGFAGYSGNIAFAILVNHCPNHPLMYQKINEFLSKLNESQQPN